MIAAPPPAIEIVSPTDVTGCDMTFHNRTGYLRLRWKRGEDFIHVRKEQPVPDGWATGAVVKLPMRFGIRFPQTMTWSVVNRTRMASILPTSWVQAFQNSTSFQMGTDLYSYGNPRPALMQWLYCIRVHPDIDKISTPSMEN